MSGREHTEGPRHAVEFAAAPSDMVEGLCGDPAADLVVLMAGTAAKPAPAPKAISSRCWSAGSENRRVRNAPGGCAGALRGCFPPDRRAQRHGHLRKRPRQQRRDRCQGAVL